MPKILHRWDKKDVIVIMLMTIITTWLFLDCTGILSLGNLSVPLSYGGGDGLFFTFNVKTINDFGWWPVNELVGQPFGGELYDFPFYSDSFHLLCIKILLFVLGGNYGLTINLFFYLIFLFTAYSSYYVMRKLGITKIISMAGSIVYTVAPYRMTRWVNHFFLSCYTFIPFMVLVFIMITEDDQYLKVNKNFFKYKKNLVTLLFLVIFALSGMYYAFFACIFFIVTLLIVFLRDYGEKNNFKNLAGKGIVFFGTIILTLLIAMIPTLLFSIKNGKNFLIEERMVIETDIYGLRITGLILPQLSHNNSFIDNILSRYDPITRSESSEYLGVIGVIGFLILIFMLFFTRSYKKKDGFITNLSFSRIIFLSRLNIAAILVATIEGFSMLFTVIITPQIRGWNRISIYILYFCILTVCFILSDYVKQTQCKLSYKRICSATILIVFVFVSHLSFLSHFSDQSALTSTFSSDEKFVEFMEESLGDDAMVLCLPNRQYPEVAPIGDLTDYGLFRGYFHSETLRWSYGGYKGRANDVFLQNIFSYPMEETLQKAAIVGYTGIYIDKRAWGEDELSFSNYLAEIEAITGADRHSSIDGKLYFYNIENYASSICSSMSVQELNEQHEKLMIVDIYDGIYSEEYDEEGTYRWAESDGSILLHNGLAEEKNATISFKVKNYAADDEYSLSIQTENGKYEYLLTSQMSDMIEIHLELEPGVNKIEFSTDTPVLNVPGEERSLSFRFYDLEINVQ